MLDLDVRPGDAVFALVCRALRACAPNAARQELSLRTLLIEELDLDSLKFVDLTVALEDALGIDEFPMQEWVDSELEAGRPLDVGSLVAWCRRMRAARGVEAP